NYNACRTPWRLSMDSLYSNEVKLKDEMKMFNNWIIKKTGSDPDKIKPGYYVRGGATGSPIPDRNYSDLSFIAPMAVSAALDKDSQQWLNQLFTYLNTYYINDETYFGNSLKLMAYFAISGNMIIPK
ncbi:MAG: hypothetical protein ACRC68_05950, partial [Clostridium sp.]